MINFTERRGAIGILLILTDSVLQLLYLELLWTKIVFKELSLTKSTELPRQSFFMSEMHFATFNFYICVYTIVTIVPQTVSALLFQTKNTSWSTYLLLKFFIGLFGALNMHLPCLIFSPLGNHFRPIVGKGPQRRWIFARNIAQIFMSIPMITNLMLIEYSGNNVVKLIILFAFT